VQGKQSDLSFVYPLAAHFLVLLGGTLTFGFAKKKIGEQKSGGVLPTHYS